MTTKRTALITGICGQDGSYLAELLLEKDYDVYGLIPQRANQNFKNVKDFINELSIVNGSVTDTAFVHKVIRGIKPDEVYNLAAQSFVKASWDCPVYTTNVNSLGVLTLLEAIRVYIPNSKFYQASTSELYGNRYPQFHPRSPYGISKLYAHYMTINYRESYKLFACCGILFNHESPRRAEHFVTQKIAKAVARIKLGLQPKLQLGNLEPTRDIGHARDYVKAMWMMLQRHRAQDYEICTEESVSIRDMVDFCFSEVGLDYKDYVVIDPNLMRPAEVYNLKGNNHKAKRELGWEPQYTWQDILREMVQYQLDVCSNMSDKNKS